MRQDLDKIAPNNPLFLTRADGHGSVANSAGLKIARIDKNTPDPFGGQILKENGEPNGMLLDNAQDLVARNIPKSTEAERQEALLRGIDREIKLGWCEVQNAGSHKDDVDLIRKAFDAGKIKIRFVNAIYGLRSGRAEFFARRIDCQRIRSPFHPAYDQSDLRWCARLSRRGAIETLQRRARNLWFSHGKIRGLATDV
jgi:predicted amidohydrolase YtcJ